MIILLSSPILRESDDWLAVDPPPGSTSHRHRHNRLARFGTDGPLLIPCRDAGPPQREHRDPQPSRWRSAAPPQRHRVLAAIIQNVRSGTRANRDKSIAARRRAGGRLDRSVIAAHRLWPLGRPHRCRRSGACRSSRMCRRGLEHPGELAADRALEVGPGFQEVTGAAGRRGSGPQRDCDRSGSSGVQGWPPVEARPAREALEHEQPSGRAPIPTVPTSRVITK